MAIARSSVLLPFLLNVVTCCFLDTAMEYDGRPTLSREWGLIRMDLPHTTARTIGAAHSVVDPSV